MTPGMQEITLDAAQEGMVLAAPLCDAGGAVLLAGGAILNGANLAALRRRGVATCLVLAEAAEGADPDPDPALLLQLQREREQHLQRLQQLFRGAAGDGVGGELLRLLQRYRETAIP